MFRKKKPIELDIELADATLQNIFEACDLPPNTIPFDKIVLRQKINTVYFQACILFCIRLLIITLLAPLPFILINHHNQKQPTSNTISIEKDYLKDDIIYFKLSVAVDPTASYLTASDGSTLEPVSYDSLTKTIAFPYLDTEASIYLKTPDDVSAVVLVTPH